MAHGLDSDGPKNKRTEATVPVRVSTVLYRVGSIIEKPNTIHTYPYAMLDRSCLLLKLIHKLHSDKQSSWAAWIQRNASIASLTGELYGHHWDMLRSLLPVYRAITTVTIRDGQTTSFWHDVWDGDDSLAERYPELYSHSKMQEITVAQAAGDGLRQSLVCRRTATADQQLHVVTELIEQLQFTEGRDRRSRAAVTYSSGMESWILHCFTRPWRTPIQV